MTISGSILGWRLHNHAAISSMGKVFTALPSNFTASPLVPPLFRRFLNVWFFIQFALIGSLFGSCLGVGRVVLSGPAF